MTQQLNVVKIGITVLEQSILSDKYQDIAEGYHIICINVFKVSDLVAEDRQGIFGIENL